MRARCNLRGTTVKCPPPSERPIAATPETLRALALGVRFAGRAARLAGHGPRRCGVAVASSRPSPPLRDLRSGSTTRASTRASHRLYIAHMDANELLAFDSPAAGSSRRFRRPGVHGVIAVPALDRVYASATNDHQALTIDARTGAILARAPAGHYPDGLAYDPAERHIFVSDESGGVETVLERRRPSHRDDRRSAAKPATSSTTQDRSASSPTCRRSTTSLSSTRARTASSDASRLPAASTTTAY